MNTSSYNANIVIIEESETNVYYQVALQFLPHAGDFIELTSLVDQESEYPSKHRLQVDQVTHQITDIQRKNGQSGGDHFVIIFASRVDVPDVLS